MQLLCFMKDQLSIEVMKIFLDSRIGARARRKGTEHGAYNRSGCARMKDIGLF